jgi:hypothetical protein
MRQATVTLFFTLAVASVQATLPWVGAPFIKRSEKSTWTPPRETGRVDADVERANGWSPRPTDAPASLFGRKALEPRLEGFVMSANTCGYVASEWSEYTPKEMALKLIIAWFNTLTTV